MHSNWYTYRFVDVDVLNKKCTKTVKEIKNFKAYSCEDWSHWTR